jgi:hypothetical protein
MPELDESALNAVNMGAAYCIWEMLILPESGMWHPFILLLLR